jgi:hypothetical protein
VSVTVDFSNLANVHLFKGLPEGARILIDDLALLLFVPSCNRTERHDRQFIEIPMSNSFFLNSWTVLRELSGGHPSSMV